MTGERGHVSYSTTDDSWDELPELGVLLGNLNINLSLVLSAPPQMKRQFESMNKMENTCVRISASALRARKHP